MATRSDARNDVDDEVHAQIQRLRSQVETLIAERAAPLLADAAGRAEDIARRGYDAARENMDAVSDRVRERPLAAVAVAGVVGYILGRLFR
jgi:ElaB/YqjD/DUF883 family membrane-anchored ribosome-binding protein